MALAFDAATQNTDFDGTATQTFAHTCTGSDRFLAVAAWTDGNFTIDGATYNGVAMTAGTTNLQMFGDATTRGRWFYLANPASGSNNVIVTVSSSGNSEIRSFAVSYTGAHQTTPVSGAVAATTVNDPVTPGTVTSAVDSLVVMLARAVTSGQTFTPGTGTTERLDLNRCFVGDEAGAASVTIDADMSIDGDNWMAFGFSLAPVGAGGGAVPVIDHYNRQMMSQGSFKRHQQMMKQALREQLVLQSFRRKYAMEV